MSFKSFFYIKSLVKKNNKLLYYSSNFIKLYLGKKNRESELKTRLRYISRLDKDYVLNRVNYYNKLNVQKPLIKAKTIGEFVYTGKQKTYFFDLLKYIRYFNKVLKFNYIFGDVIEIPDEPTIVKSRPVGNSNENSVLLKLNKIRHFNFIEDITTFSQKSNDLVWRGSVWESQPQRINFLKKYYQEPGFNIGHINENRMVEKWPAEKLTIFDQLQYKFIMCIEGNDVASNLKWVMSSNSVAVMPHPKFETWFMEGTLIPDYHYILVKDDYSDLEKKLAYYRQNDDKAIAIAKNANAYIKQFKNNKQEDLISLMVLQKYFDNTYSAK